MSWKQYGGTSNFNIANNIRTHTLVCDFFTLREAYQGEFDISGTLVVYDDASMQSTLHVAGNTYLNSDLFVGMDTSMQGNLFVGGNESLVGAFYIGDNSSQYFYGLPNGMGVGLNTMTPEATLDICGNQVEVLRLFSNQTENLNIIAQNNNHYGITVDAMDYTSSVDFYGRDENTFTVSLLAGNPDGNRGTTDGSGIYTLFNFPLAVTTDGSGNFFVMDADVIRKITIQNSIYYVTSVAGTPGVVGYKDGIGFPAKNNSSITNSFNYPFGLAVDSNQNIYIADTNNHLIRRGLVLTDGSYQVITIAGDLASLQQNGYSNQNHSNFTLPPPFGELVGNNSGWNDGIGTDTSFNYPSGIVVDMSGNILVADSGNNVIRKMTYNGSSFTVTTVAGTPGVSGFQDGTGQNALFNYPTSLTKDNNGGYYVVDAGNNVIRKMTYSNNGKLTVVTIAGNYSEENQYRDGIGTQALFNVQNGIVSNTDGTILYITDTKNSLIRQLTKIIGGVNDGSYNVTTVAGTVDIVTGKPTTIGYYNQGKKNGVGNQSSFVFPNGLTLDFSGNLIVADTNNQLIRMVSPISDVSANKIESGNAAAQIIYQSNYVTGKTIEITAPDNTLIYSTLSVSNRSQEFSHITKETVVIYDISSAPFLPLVYNQPYCYTGNALSLVANDLSSNTFLNITTPLDIHGNSRGVSIGGGAYPSDINRSMGMIGWTDVMGTFQTSLTIVSGSDPIKYKSTVGINTYHPITEKYILDANGPIRVSNGTIVNTGNQTFEIKSVGISRIDSNQLIAVGTSSTIGNGLYTPYTYNALVSENAGSSWTLYPINCTNYTNNLQFQQYAHNFISTYVYDTSYALIGSNDGYLFYTVNGGKNWAKISLFNSNTVLNDFIYSIYITPFDNFTSNISNNLTLNTNLSTNQKFMDIAVSEDGQYQTAVTDGSGIWISSDFGIHWQQVSTYLYKPTSSIKSLLNLTFTCISVSTDGLVQSAGVQSYLDNGVFKGLYIRSLDYGVSWTCSTANDKVTVGDVPANYIDNTLVDSNNSQTEFTIATDNSGNSYININSRYIFVNGTALSSNLDSQFGISNPNCIQNMTSIAFIKSAENFFTKQTVFDVSSVVIVTDGSGIWNAITKEDGYGYGNFYFTKVFNSTVHFTAIAVSYTGQYQTAVSTQFGIFISINFGLTWLPCSNNSILLGINFTCVSLNSLGSVQFAGSNGSGIWFSTDLGKNWYQLVNLPYNWKSIKTYNNGSYNLFTAVTYGNGLYNFLNQNKRCFLLNTNSLSYFDVDFSTSPFLSCVDSSLNYSIVTSNLFRYAMDGYKTNLYLTSNKNVLYYNIQSNTLNTINISNTNQKQNNNQISVYQEYVLTSSPDTLTFIDISNVLIYSVNNIITKTLSFGTDISINNIYLYDSLTATAIGNDGSNNSYLLRLEDYNQWNIIGPDILNSSGNETLLIDVSNHLTNIVMPNINTFLVYNTTQNFNSAQNKLGHSNVFNCFFPNVYNSFEDIVVDISGSLRTSGNMTMFNGNTTNLNIENHLNVNGYIELPDRSVQISATPDLNYNKFGFYWFHVNATLDSGSFIIYPYIKQISMSANGQYQYLYRPIKSNSAMSSSDYGNTWNAVTFNQTGASFSLNNVFGVSANGQYVTTFRSVGVLGYNNNNIVVYSHDYGLNWNESLDIIGNEVFQIAISANGQYQTITNHTNIFISSNYGVNWTQSPFIIDNYYNTNCNSLSMSASGKYQAICQDRNILVSEDFGVNWYKISITSNNTLNIVISSSSFQYLTVSTSNGGQESPTNQNYIYYSHTFGKTWNLSIIHNRSGGIDTSFNGVPFITMSSSGKYQCAAVSFNQFYPINRKNNPDSVIYTSNDYGVNWFPQQTNFKGSVFSIVMSSDGKYITAHCPFSGISYSIIPYASVFADQLLFSASGVIFDLSSLTINGNVYANSYNVTSDYRVKKNVALLDDNFVVDGLRPITYFNEMTAKQDIGFLAHEVQELYPCLVSGIKDDTHYQSLNYMGLIGILVKEIKELKRQVKILSEK